MSSKLQTSIFIIFISFIFAATVTEIILFSISIRDFSDSMRFFESRDEVIRIHLSSKLTTVAREVFRFIAVVALNDVHLIVG
jgi:hypothetical protein